MKKVIIGVIAAVGVFGIIALMRFHPAASTDSTASSTTTDTSTPAASDSSTSSSSTTPAASSSAPTTSASYKNGTYSGSASINRYGAVQVKAVISGGKLTNVVLVQMPNEENRSAQISSMAGPQLVQEAITAQSANVDIVSGATSTSESFAQSLQSAMNAAKA